MRSKWTAAVLLTLATTVSAASAATQARPREAPAGEGVMCALVLYSAHTEIVERCGFDSDPEVQAELRRQVERLETYVLANGMTPVALADFKRTYLEGLADDGRCADHRADGFDGNLDGDIAEIRTLVDGMVARPGTPTWGACV